MIINNQLRNFDKYRRNKMRSIESALYKLFASRHDNDAKLLETNEVKKILIIRNNKRVGNVLFLLPFVKELVDIYPHAKVDLMINKQWQEQVFENIGINRFYNSNFSFGDFFKWVMMMFEVRKNHYDLVILPKSSSGDTINAALVNATNKVSVYDPKREFVFTHPLVIKDGYKHAALGPLSLLKAMGHKIDVVTDSHHLIYTSQEKKSAMAIVQKLTKDDSKFVTMAFFRGARGDKQLSNECWSRVLERFDDAMSNTIQWIEILSPDIESPLREDYDVYQSSNLRELGLVLAYLNGFICCDTGPLHLADAAGAKCIGLYTHTNTDNFGVLGEKSVNITNIDNFNALSVCRTLNLTT